jgi:hypothetical protein
MDRMGIKMAKPRTATLSEEAPPFQRWRDLPHIPATDNEPGAPEVLLKANRILRGSRWPAPYDRTRHEMILGDARDLKTIPNESAHLVVTSPPYFNLKPYASNASGRQLGRIDDYEDFLDELTEFGKSASEFSFQAVEFVVSSVTF